MLETESVGVRVPLSLPAALRRELRVDSVRRWLIAGAASAATAGIAPRGASAFAPGSDRLRSARAAAKLLRLVLSGFVVSDGY